MTQRHTLHSTEKGGKIIYRTGQFARKTSVTSRTLRYYDRVGLLSPSARSESGYRLYSDEDVPRLQRILALKYLGFSLDEIRVCLDTGPQLLGDALAQQRAVAEESRRRLDRVIKSIEDAEGLLRAGRSDWESVLGVIEVIAMEQNKDWHKKYFTEEQLAQMEETSSAAYSDEARARLAERGAAWTEEDQRRIDVQWAEVNAELSRLTAEGAAPDGPEAIAWAARYFGLIGQFTAGDPEVEAGLNRWWELHNALPEEERPVQGQIYSPQESEFLEKATAAYRRSQE